MTNDFLDNSGIIRGPPIRKKAILSRTDHLKGQGSQSICYDFGHYFVLDVAQSNRSEVPHIGSIMKLSNKEEVGSVHPRIHGGRGKSFSVKLDSSRAHNIPIFLVHQWVDPIWACRLIRLEKKDNLCSILIRERFDKEGVVSTLNRAMS